MPEINEIRDLPYSAQQIYDLVADVAAYPQFLPWTQSARIRNHSQTGFEADLVMGFQFVRETFTSRVTLYPEAFRVHAEGIGGGPFSKLINDWRITPSDDTSCHVDFRVEFEIAISPFAASLNPYIPRHNVRPWMPLRRGPRPFIRDNRVLPGLGWPSSPLNAFWGHLGKVFPFLGRCLGDIIA